MCCFANECAHLLDDPQNCGGCSISCPSGQSCSQGTCSGSPNCGPGHIGEYCDLDAGFNFVCCAGYGCIDTSSDRSNCGGCGVFCAGQCTGGTCV
jgi:hypothetical protein